MLNPNIKINNQIDKKILKIFFQKRCLSTINEDTSFTEISDEELLKMCNYSLDRYNRLSKRFTKRFLGTVMIVCGIGTGAMMAALEILDRIDLYYSELDIGGIGLASGFIVVLGKYIKYKEKPYDEIKKELNDLLLSDDIDKMIDD